MTKKNYFMLTLTNILLGLSLLSCQPSTSIPQQLNYNDRTNITKKSIPEPNSLNTALIILDMQETYFNYVDKKEWQEEFPNYLSIIESAKQNNVPIYLIEFDGAGKTIDEITQALGNYNYTSIIKTTDNVFESTSLYDLLNQNNSKYAILVGFYGSQCITDSGIGGYNKGFHIGVSEELMSDNPHYDKNLPLKLYEKFSTVYSVEEIIKIFEMQQ
jgi:isochorismate hydrolase